MFNKDDKDMDCRILPSEEEDGCFERPLGDLVKQMSRPLSRNYDELDYLENSQDYNSDNTVQSNYSVELFVNTINHNLTPCKMAVGDEEHLILEKSPALSQVSLFDERIPSPEILNSIATDKFPQITSGETLFTKEHLLTDPTKSNMHLNDLVIASSNPSASENKSCKHVIKTDQLSKPKRRKRAKKWNERNFVKSQIAEISVLSQPSMTNTTTTRQKSLRKLHCMQMEELNIIEAKLSSVAKLLSTKCYADVGYANKLMRDTMKRITKIEDSIDRKLENYSSSESEDGESEREMNLLLNLRRARLQRILDDHARVAETVKVCSAVSLTEKVADNKHHNINTRSRLQSGVSGDLVSAFSTFDSKLKLYSPAKASIRSKINTISISPKQSIVFVPLATSASNVTKKKIKPFVKSSVAVAHVAKLKTKELAECFPMKKCEEPTVTSGKMQFVVADSQVIANTPTSSFSHNITDHRTKIKPHKSLVQPAILSTCAGNLPTLYRPRMETSTSCLELCQLLKLGRIRRGTDVLSYYEGTFHTASIVGNGLILSLDLQIHVSVMAWIKSISSKTTQRINAYKQVMYNGISLYDISVNGINPIHKTKVSSVADQHTAISDPSFSLHSDGQTFSKDHPTSSHTHATFACVGNPLHAIRELSNPLDDLCGYLKKCKVQLALDDELFVTSSLFSNQHPWSEEKLMNHLFSHKS